jgi:hypothetical protein
MAPQAIEIAQNGRGNGDPQGSRSLGRRIDRNGASAALGCVA